MYVKQLMKNMAITDDGYLAVGTINTFKKLWIPADEIITVIDNECICVSDGKYILYNITTGVVSSCEWKFRNVKTMTKYHFRNIGLTCDGSYSIHLHIYVR